MTDSRIKDDSQRINVDFPTWMIEGLDREAERLGIPRQAVIKFFVDQKLKEIEQARKVS